MDHSFDDDGDVHMREAPQTSPVYLSVEMDFDESPSFTSTPVRRIPNVLAARSSVPDQVLAPQWGTRTTAPFAVSKRRLEEDESSSEQGPGKRPRLQHDNRSHVAPRCFRRVRASPTNGRVPATLGRDSVVGQLLRSIGQSLVRMVTGTKDQQDAQHVAAPISNNQRRCDGVDTLRMPGAWPAFREPSAAPPLSTRARRVSGSLRGGRRLVQSARIEKAVKTAELKKKALRGWWIKEQRESGVLRKTERAAVVVTALSPIREVSEPAQSEAAPTPQQQPLAPVERHHAQAHADGVSHEQARALPSPPLATPISHVKVKSVAASSPAEHLPSPIAPAEEIERYITTWRKRNPHKIEKPSMRGLTKSQREAERDRKLDELIQKSKQLAIDPPEVAEIKREARQAIERRKKLELDQLIKTDLEINEERLLRGDREPESKKKEDSLAKEQSQRTKEAEAQQAARAAEQAARDAALQAEIRATEARLRAQERAHESIARRTRSSQGFKLAGALNDEWAAKVNNITSNRGGDSDQLATTERGAGITRLTFERILGTARRGAGAWLDDDAVNTFILSLVDAKNKAAGWDMRTSRTAPPYVTFNSAWWTTYRRERGPSGIKNWAKRQKMEGRRLLDVIKVYLPVNTGVHWTIVIVSPKDKKIQFLDSMDGRGVQELAAVRAWLAQELGAHYNAADWTEERGISQQQNNSDDCGVFTCYNALASAMDLPFRDIAANKMPNARKQMAAILLNGGFSGIFKI